jgi:diguanylate cyclase (GGDEF)-like protein
MALQRPRLRAGATQPRLTPARSSALGKEVRLLGGALVARVTDVLALTAARAERLEIDPAMRGRAEQISRISTLALARWLAGENPGVAREAGEETWRFYGEVAARREASLRKIVMHCLLWRDAVAEVLRESSAELDTSAAALSETLEMLQQGLEFGFVQISESFDDERKRTDDDLAFLSSHDTLTGLPNRTALLDRAGQMLARARRHKTPTAALLIGLDNFRSVNETFGRSTGDELLRAVTERLDGVARAADTLGRLGGDEFVVLAEGLPPEEGAVRVAERLHEALERPFKLAGVNETQLLVTASIGIATTARSSPEEFLRDADIAMYQAKWDGRNRYAVFESGMQDAVQSRMELEMDLREALLNDEFFLVYQPTFNLRDMTPTGVEALIRWKHPTRAIVGPDDFIPLLESTGLIIEVGRWVLRQACRQGASWHAVGHAIGMAVNVSARQLDSDALVTDVREALAESGLDASALTLEITETTLMRNVEETAQRLVAIRELGVRIAIDDFGTGYSSLNHLQQFPVDALKIDRSFVSRLTQAPEGEALVHTLVALGKALSIETLAEGIEKPDELSLLQAEQCDSGQGFLFARPMSATAAGEFLQTWDGAGAAEVRAVLRR